MHKKTLIILTVFTLFLASCFKVTVPPPSKITIIKNGDIKTVDSNDSQFHYALQKTAEFLASSLVVRKTEAYSREKVEEIFKSNLDGYKLEYNSIQTLSILRVGGYTKDVNFKTLYVINKAGVILIFFVHDTSQVFYPNVPFSNSMIMR